jgi:plasmid stabilization system protein ParE
MAFEVVRSADAIRDLELIFDYLVEAYQAFGEPLPEAFDRARKRIESMKLDMRNLVRAPYQGTLMSDVRPGLRHVTKNQAIVYFEVDEVHEVIRILAIFYNGQDHGRHIQARLGNT